MKWQRCGSLESTVRSPFKAAPLPSPSPSPSRGWLRRKTSARINPWDYPGRACLWLCPGCPFLRPFFPFLSRRDRKGTAIARPVEMVGAGQTSSKGTYTARNVVGYRNDFKSCYAGLHVIPPFLHPFHPTRFISYVRGRVYFGAPGIPCVPLFSRITLALCGVQSW